MSKYFSHKPQWRSRNTAGRPVIEMKRDFRSGTFEFSGPVYKPDPLSTPGRVPEVRRKGSPLPQRWSSPKNFNSAAGQAARARRQLARDLGRGMGQVFRWAGAINDMYDVYQSLDKAFGGEPYNVGGPGEPWQGGPNGDESTTADPLMGGYITIPTPDGGPMSTIPNWLGWNLTIHDWFYQAMRGYGTTGSFLEWRMRLHNKQVGSFPNHNGTYGIPTADAWPVPTKNFVGGFYWQTTSTLPVETGTLITDPEVWDNTVQCRGLDWTHWAISPDTGPVELPADYPGPFRTPNGTPEEISANWPTTGGGFQPAVMPWPMWGKGIPWDSVGLVNRYRNWLGIREENFTEPPQVPPGAPVETYFPQPPGPGSKERKGRSNSAALLWFYQTVRKAWHEIDEATEKLDILYDALPGWVRNRVRAKKPHEKIKALYDYWQYIDVNDAVMGLIINEVEDAAIGRGFKSLDSAFERLNVRGWRGEMGMQYSVESLFELYGSLKGLL